MIDLLPGINSAAAALDAERIRMDVVSQNIANVDTTRGIDGKPYQRQQVVFESVLKAQQGSEAPDSAAQTLQIARVEKDNRPPRMVYNPSHPDANAQGMVAMPDINIAGEMVDMITSSRAYEANLAVVKNSRSMAMQALSIGKH
ncbi:MAG TPA: flagellar basal body rod protein FlgC [Candidatus Baltobacteraceae bacterium]|jgi:flagellar basal-body rod protein FlgC|nr:flagellar basal body rod protein FlgC [Candidatus Baltobacteraceae bacterium]